MAVPPLPRAATGMLSALTRLPFWVALPMAVAGMDLTSSLRCQFSTGSPASTVKWYSRTEGASPLKYRLLSSSTTL